MTGQHESDPNNRFETWADGMTPSGQEPPARGTSGASASEPPLWTPPTNPHRSSSDQDAQSFPTYPYSSAQAPYADPRPDEAYAAFQGYQADRNSLPHTMQPHQAYQAPYNYGHRRYGATAPKASYAVPSFVLGIVSVFCGGVTGPIGLGFGIAALKQVQSDPRLGGKGLAIAGIATSAFGTFLLLLFILGAISA